MLSFITHGAVKREESLFQKAVDVDTQFVPTFTAPPLPRNASFTENDVNRLCGNNVQCRFDFKVTGQKQIAEATIRTSQWFDRCERFNSQVPTTCVFHFHISLYFCKTIRDTHIFTKSNILPCHGAQSFLTLEYIFHVSNMGKTSLTQLRTCILCAGQFRF